MHPNAEGYSALTDQLLAWSQTADFDRPPRFSEWLEASEPPGWLAGAHGALASALRPGFIGETSIAADVAESSEEAVVQDDPERLQHGPQVITSAATPAYAGAAEGNGEADQMRIYSARAGSTVEVDFGGLAVGSSARIVIGPYWELVGVLEVDESGHARGTLRLPIELVPGPHTLTMLGMDEKLSPIVHEVQLDVAQAIPWWWLPLLALCLLCLLAAAWTWWRAARSAPTEYGRAGTSTLAETV